jgi:hypothetical protein
MQDLEAEKVSFRSDFNAAIGQLRYALHLQEERASKAQQPAAQEGSPASEGHPSQALAAGNHFGSTAAASDVPCHSKNTASPSSMCHAATSPVAATTNAPLAHTCSAVHALVPRNHATHDPDLLPCTERESNSPAPAANVPEADASVNAATATLQRVVPVSQCAPDKEPRATDNFDGARTTRSVGADESFGESTALSSPTENLPHPSLNACHSPRNQRTPPTKGQQALTLLAGQCTLSVSHAQSTTGLTAADALCETEPVEKHARVFGGDFNATEGSGLAVREATQVANMEQGEAGPSRSPSTEAAGEARDTAMASTDIAAVQNVDGAALTCLCPADANTMPTIDKAVWRQLPVAALRAPKQAEVAEALLKGFEEDEDCDDECPVCNEPLSTECMMGPCMHRWCGDCHGKLKKMANFKCPLCNQAMSPRQCMLVSLNAAEEKSVQGGPMADVGAYGTKIKAVVQCIQQILHERCDDKVRLCLRSGYQKC